MSDKPRSLPAAMLAELLGTFLLVFFGCGAVHVAVLTGGLAGLAQVAIVWGVAIMLAVYCLGAISGAHINPAITIALASRRRFAWSRVLPYVAAQWAGGALAAAVLFLCFAGPLAAKEREKGVQRGQPGSELTAMCYGEYYPNPGPLATLPTPYSIEEHEQFNELVSERVAFGAEFVGTGILGLMVLALTDPRKTDGPGNLAGVFIGLTVAALICVIAPLTQACFNPARDFGPRVFAALAGWGSVALPGPRGWGILNVYLLAPILGATAGMALYDLVLYPKSQNS